MYKITRKTLIDYFPNEVVDVIKQYVHIEYILNTDYFTVSIFENQLYVHNYPKTFIIITKYNLSVEEYEWYLHVVECLGE